MPEEDPGKRAFALYQRYLQTNDLRDLRESVELLRHAAAASPANPARFANLGAGLVMLFDREGGPELLPEAVAAAERAVKLSPRSPAYLSNLSTALELLFQQTSDDETLARAVRTARAAVESTPDGDALLTMRLSNLCNTLRSSYLRGGDEAAIVEAVTAAERAARLLTGPGDEASRLLSNLANARWDLAHHRVDPALLSAAVATFQDALDATPHDHPNRPDVLANLAVRRGAVAANDADADAAVELARQALNQTDALDPDRPHKESCLASTLRTRYNHTGDVRSLVEATALARSALLGTDADHVLAASRQAEFGNALRALHERTGQLALAEQAVESTSRAVAITPPGDPARARYLVNVASAYLVLHERTDDAAHARTAVEFNRQAIDELGEDHPDLLGTLTQTIAPLVALASATNDEALFAEAVEIGRRVSSVPDDHRDVIPACSNAAHALLRRHDHTDDPRDALEALDLADRAARLTPDGSPHLPPVLNTLGGAQLKAGRIDDARHSFSRSAGAPSATVLDRIRAWRYLGRIELVANDPEAAVAAFAQAVSLLPRLTPQRFLRGDREFGLGQTTGIAAEAAAAAVRAGRPRQAVELIEQARTLLMSETLDARSDLRTLSELEPGLHGELQRLRDVIDAADHPVEAGLVGSPSAVRRDELTSEWNDLLDRIRTRPGLGTFLLPQPLGVDRGPVVFTYATRWGSGALVLGPGGTIDAVALPGITDISAAEQGDLFESASIAVTKASSYQARKAALDDMHAVLKWLWDNVTEPVLDHLGHTSPSSSDWPRVWWCPISVMSSLPLHAAGHHDEGPHRTVLDRVVSSYTTSMRTHAREPRRKGDAATLIVAMPETPGASPLPSASAEAAVITRMIPGAAVLTGADATRTAVERALVRHPIAHVACHAIGDALDPGGSRLLLHDHDTAGLTVAEVSRLDLPDADLVFLSACNTTDSAPRLVDEAVHITGAFHLAGYRHVIGTLTPVNSTAARVAGTVYEMLTNGGTKPPDTTDAALALHRAVRQIRADHLDAPHTWAAWIHVGL